MGRRAKRRCCLKGVSALLEVAVRFEPVERERRERPPVTPSAAMLRGATLESNKRV
jgi:hypothetical protein|tara:strand:+ start:1464 stop:1631 length:168 start_codon:yes stop_codon:yes gene_type:complete